MGPATCIPRPAPVDVPARDPLDDALDAVGVLKADEQIVLELADARAVGAALDDTDCRRFAIGWLADDSTLIVDEVRLIAGGRSGAAGALSSSSSSVESSLRSLNPRLVFGRRSGAGAASFWSARERFASDVLGGFGMYPRTPEPVMDDARGRRSRLVSSAARPGVRGGAAARTGEDGRDLACELAVGCAKRVPPECTRAR
jgi:hypothetical protein